MSTNDSPQGYQPSQIDRVIKPLGEPLDIERATVAIPAEPFVQETDWMNFNGYEAKFRRVPAFAYAKARQHLRRVMRDNRPEPPTVSQGTRQMVNKADPYYQAQMSLWEQEWEDLQRDILSTTSVLVGLVLRHPVPADEDWVPFVIDILSSLGIQEHEIFTSFKYGEAKMRELLFKQYVILSDPTDMEKFNQFQANGNTDDEGNEEGQEDGYVEAVDMFRPEQE